MITYLKNIGRFTYNQLKNKSFKEIQKLYEKEQKWIKDFIPMDSEEGRKKAASSKKRPRAEPDEKSVKRQKIGETSGSGEEQSAEKEKELSEEELQKLLVVVPVEEVYIEALQDLVKKRFSTTEPTNDKEKELWVELKRLFKPDNDDILSVQKGSTSSKFKIIKKSFNLNSIDHGKAGRGDAASRHLSLSNVMVPLIEPLSAENLISEASMLGVPAAVAATTALSTTFVQANSVLPILASDHEVVDTEPQVESSSSPKIIFEQETSPENPTA
ncbi:hypothetical protein Tco_0833518 [Tanacetum coccineum]